MNDTNEEKLKELEEKIDSLQTSVSEFQSKLDSLFKTASHTVSSLKMLTLLNDDKEKRINELEVIVGSLVSINSQSGNFKNN